MYKQLDKTIKRTVSIEGSSLFSNKNINITFKSHDDGIVFHIQKGVKYKSVKLSNTSIPVINTKQMTTIGNEFVYVKMVEHLLAVFHLLEITSIAVYIQGDSIPIFDGSGKIYYDLLIFSGFTFNIRRIPYIKCNTILNVGNDKSNITYIPDDDFIVDMTIDFPDTIIGKQHYNFSIYNITEYRDIINARTFISLSEINNLIKNKIITNGSNDNAIVYDGYDIVSSNKLNSKDEFVKHKILDFIGDIYLTGFPIKGKFICYCSGHSLNNKILNELLINI